MDINCLLNFLPPENKERAFVAIFCALSQHFPFISLSLLGDNKKKVYRLMKNCHSIVTGNAHKSLSLLLWRIKRMLTHRNGFH
jgi:hypothetical protein